ncbi:MAG: InlB B-repeat-containing protein, partial [Oscillospiraceae bacterium]|nr:InlB B-repeat-containing protein [Oscillospiraceae bacterium]
MKIYKTLRKRGLALFLALTMCLSLIQTTAFANEEAEHAHNEGGWTCAYTDPVTEPACAHEHDAACGYVEAVEESPCACTGTDEEGGVVHEDGCAYAPAVEGAPCGHVCGGECAAVVTEGYWECTPPAGEPEETEPTEDAEVPAGDAEVPEEDAEAPAEDTEVPAEVQAFLDAVAAIPEITAENAAEVAEYVYGPVSEAYDALLGTEYEERDDVQEAIAVYAAALEAVDVMMGIEDDTFAVYPQYQPYFNAQIISVSRGTVSNQKRDDTHAKITTFVDEAWNFQRLPHSTITGSYCGHQLYICAPKFYNNPSIKSCDSTIIHDEGYTIGTWQNSSLMPAMNGSDCLQWNFTTLKPGTTTAVSHYYARWDNRTSAGACPICWTNTAAFDNRNVYYEYTDRIPIEVNARYRLNYDSQGGSNVAATSKDVAKTSATLNVTSTVPIREGYTFKGWAESPDAKAKDVVSSVTLNWEAGKGSTATPVEKTLYAVWEEDGGTPNAPDAPKRKDLYSILHNFVKVQCVSAGNSLPHDEKTYHTWTRTVDGQYEASVGVPYQGENGMWKVDVTLHGKVYAEMYSCEPIFGVGEAHTLAEGEAEIKTITLTWNSDTEKWTSGQDKNTVLATFKVVCQDEGNDTAKITGFEKKLVKSPNEVPSDLKVSGITYPNADGKVTIPEGGTVTLLYKITVTGTEGTQYKVTDKGAEWVGGDPMEGTIPESGSAVIYVTKSFTKTDINENGKLVNIAIVTPGKDDESSTSSNETTQAEEAKTIEYNVVYKANPNDNGVENLPACETKQGTAPGSVSFTVSSQVPTREGYTFAGWEVQGKVLKGGDMLTVTASAAATSVTEYLYATWTKNLEKPEAPSHQDVRNLVKAAVKVICEPGRHSSNSTFGYSNEGQLDRITIGEVIGDAESGYTCEVTFLAQKFCDAYNTLKGTTSDATKHTLVSGSDNKTVTFEWNAEKKAWELPDNFTGPVTFYVECPKPEEPIQPTAKIEVQKKNNGFNVNSQTGNASVNYTVEITNTSGYDIYGLRLTDTLTANLTPDDGNVTFTFTNWKVDGQDITPTSGGENEMEHVFQLLPRNAEFKAGKIVTLTYTVEIENNSDGEVEVELKNEATGASWSKAPANPAARTLSLRAANEDDEPDVTDSDSSSASTDNDAPDVTDSDTSTAGGPTGDSGTEGTLPKKYTVTYDWNLPVGASETLPAGGKYPAGATVTVDTSYGKGRETSADGKTYVFSGWSTTDVTVTDGGFIMPEKNVTITGTWTEREEQPPVDPLSVSAADVRVTYDGKGHPVIPTANKDGVQFSVVYKGANGVVGVPTDAGVYTAEITATLNGETASCTASVTITRRPLTVTTGSGSKYYDGTPLTNSTATVVVTGGEVPGEHITAVATGSRTVAGSSTNTYTMNWGSAKESNYTVTESLGTLTVLNRAPIIPPPPSGGGNTGGGTTIPDTQTPLDPGTTIADQDVPLAAPGLNNTDHFD